MKKGIIARKVGMTQIYSEDGLLVPVTVVEAGPCKVVQKKTVETDGYDAVQLGFYEETKTHRKNKPRTGHFAKAGVNVMRHLKEFRLEDVSGYEAGASVDVSQFAEKELVDVAGTSIGKGFQGVMKRHNFAGGPASHGSQFHRSGGSIGMCEYPGKTLKNQGMPGRMGGKKVVTQRLEVMKVIPEQNLLLIKGAVPGHKSGIVYITDTVKPVI